MFIRLISILLLVVAGLCVPLLSAQPVDGPPHDPSDSLPEVVPSTAPAASTSSVTAPAPATAPMAPQPPTSAVAPVAPATEPASVPETPGSTESEEPAPPVTGAGPELSPESPAAEAPAQEQRPMIESLRFGSKLFGFKIVRLDETSKENLLEQFFKKDVLDNRENYGAVMEAMSSSLEAAMALPTPAERARALGARVQRLEHWLEGYRSDKEIPAELIDFCQLYLQLRRQSQLERSAPAQSSLATLEKGVDAYLGRYSKQPWGPFLAAMSRDLADRRHLKSAQEKPADELLGAASTLALKDAQLHYTLGQLYREYSDRKDISAYLKLVATEFEKCLMSQRRNKELFAEITAAYVEIHETLQKAEAQEPFWFEELVYRRIIALDPSNASAHNNLSFLYSQYGVNIKDALREAQIANQLKPNDPLLLDTLGWAQYKNNTLDKAIETLKQALSLGPEIADIHFHLATVYYDQDDVENATKYFRETIKLEPDNVFAHNNLAYLFSEKDVHLEEGLALVDKAIEKQPDNAAFIDTKGWLYFKMKKYDLAVEFLRKSVELSPETSELHLHLGKVYLAKRDYEQAIKSFESALAYDPENTKIARELAYMFAMNGLKDSLERYSRIGGVGASRENFKVFYDAMAQAAMSQGDAENAARALAEYSSLIPQKATSLLALPPTTGTSDVRPVQQQLDALGEILPGDTDLVLSVEKPGLVKLATFFAKAMAQRYGLSIPQLQAFDAIPPRLALGLRRQPGSQAADFLVVVELTSPVFDFYWQRLSAMKEESQELSVPIGQMNVPLTINTASYKGVAIRSVVAPQGVVYFLMTRPHAVFSMDRAMLTALVDRVEANGKGLQAVNTWRIFSSRQRGDADVLLFLPFRNKEAGAALPPAYQSTFKAVQSFGAAYTMNTTDELSEQSLFVPVPSVQPEALLRDLEQLLGTIRKDLAEKLSKEIRLEASFKQEEGLVVGQARVVGFSKLVSEMLASWYRNYLPSLDLLPQPSGEQAPEKGPLEKDRPGN